MLLLPHPAPPPPLCSSFPILFLSASSHRSFYHSICFAPLVRKRQCLVAYQRRATMVQQSKRIWHEDPGFLVPLHIWSRGLSRMLASLVVLIALGLPADPFSSIPPNLSGEEKGQRVQRPKSRKAEKCTQKCVSTCIRGGAGAPGEGPLNVRRPLVVFKDGFRTRQYCLVECSDICNLIGDGDDGP